jgi:serine/threonine protein kinase
MAAEAGTTKAVAPRYKLEELTRVCELGKGILSKVFLYKHADTGELIAVKEVEKAKVLSKGLLPRVLAERDTLRKLAGLQVPCPHVPAFHGNTQDKSTLYFFSEPALAGPLHLHIAESDGGLPEASARFYAQEVALALAALHEMGVGHRDLKASNVVLR